MNEVLNSKTIKKSVAFLRQAFEDNPHYSFGDWTIMADHSEQVMHYALQLAEDYTRIDKTVVALGALFHDIGKTVKADEQTLLEKHEEMGLEVTKDFLPTLDLTPEQIRHIESLYSLDNNSLEKDIIKDADYIDFFINDKLHNAAKKWADETNNFTRLQRKFDRFERMLPEAKKLAQPSYEELKKRWDV